MEELVIEARIENLSIVQDFIAGELKSCDCSMKLQTQISIVVEEVFVNIAYYAYSQDAWVDTPLREQYEQKVGHVTIRVTVADEVTIEFEDNGKPYNPLKKNDPDITLGAEEREIGGLGIFMVKNIMDTVKYRYEDSKNILLLKKRVA